MVALVALSVVSAAGAARPAPTQGPTGDVTPSSSFPLGLSNRPQTVIVELAGDPVAVADANSAAPFTKGEWDSHRDQLRSQQAPVASQISSLGGQVLASYQQAYNGIKVRIAASQEDSLKSIAGVVAVHPVQILKPDNVHGVPLVGGPAVWGGVPGLAGEHIKIADIDTGIDYTHADFGGPGTPLAYSQAFATDTLPPAPTLVGPLAPKVKGGVDLVGDDYNADPTDPSTYQPVPHPDLNPLDCNSHGTHTAGTMAGFGVKADGTTFHGPYNATTISDNNWLVGPGVAPKADLYAVRVFGCSGSTDVVVDAIEWAVANHMDVINMSLGSPLGSPDSPDAVASTNAARDGTIVIASSGNNGPNPYITGTPASSPGALGVAASDPTQTFPAAVLGLSTGDSVTAINANGFAPLPAGPLGIVVIRNGAQISTGCFASDYASYNVTGKVAVVQRGGPTVNGTPCARVHKAIVGQQQGAAAVIMVNTSASLPPFEGPIAQDPNTGQSVIVHIPFLGVRGGTNPPPAGSDGFKVMGADGGTTTLTAADLSNPGFLQLAGFSSGGPATGDSSLKPNVTAPGVSIASAGMGTGNGPLINSGTSMAAPHTTGVAALVKQAHPDWRKVKYWEAAISNTADPGMVNGYATRGAGSGFIQALPATQTQVVALGSMGRGGWNDDDNHEGGRHGGNAQAADLNFGFNEIDRDFSQTATVQLRNFSNSPQTFTVSDALDQGSPHSVSFDTSTVTVWPRSGRDVRVRLSVPLSTAGGASYPGFTPFSDVSGLVTFTPVGGSNNGVTLRVPYYMVPQATSHVSTRIDVRRLIGTGTTTARTTNRSAADGTADWYALGISDKRTKALGSDDIRAVGASVPAPGFVQFAISTYHRWSNASQNEFDVFVDVNGDGQADYDVVAADGGALQGNPFDGTNLVAVFDLHTHNGSIAFVANSPTDSSTVTLPVKLSQLQDANPATSLDGTVNKRITYWVQSFGLTDNTSDSPTAKAVFNPFSPAVSTGMFDSVPANGSATETLTVNPTELLQSPALGWMVVSPENPSGSDEAQLIGLRGDH